MKLKDMLAQEPVNEIELRFYSPTNEGMLFGFCRWNGKGLLPLCSNDYEYYNRYLNEEVKEYSVDDDSGVLTCWLDTQWL